MWANSQAVVAGVIVVALTVLGLGLLLVAYLNKDIAALAMGAIGTIVGALATALSTPRNKEGSANDGQTK